MITFLDCQIGTPSVDFRLKRDLHDGERDQCHVKKDLDGRFDVMTFDDNNIYRCVMSKEILVM
jgi:hypothetical protein